MIASHIRGETRRPGAPEDWDENLDGPVVGLPIRDEVDLQSGHNVMYSLWYPTPEELAILNSGGGVRLGVMGYSHPVVNMEAIL